MRQYQRFKKEHPECVLFFRMGDFYEMFYDDAQLCHRVLGITLTQRTEGVPMAGVPYHAVESYLRRMIEQGHRVAVCEQIEDPRDAKGVVERAVTRVISPGTLVDESLLEESRANHIAAIQFTEAGDKSNAVLALAELSTGSFTLHDLPADRVVDELARLAPSEILFVETADGNVPPRVARLKDSLGCALTARPSWTFRPTDALDILRAHYGVATLSGFGLREDDSAIAPAGALVRYLQETQPGAGEPSNASKPSLAHLRPPRRQSVDDFVTIDATSLRALEIERTMRTGGVEGSLLSTLQRCRTPMGKRLLRQWLCFPLRDIERIECRQRAVGAFMEDRDLADSLAELISSVQDVARIAGRIATGRANPRDLVALGKSVGQISAIADLLDARPAFKPVHDQLKYLAAELLPLAERIASMCVDSPPAHMREGGLVRDGADRALDESRALQRDANQFLARYQQRLVEETGIASLKVGYNRVFGYYIEITNAHARKSVPESFSRKQTLKNAERYVTPELKEWEEKISSAEERALAREQALFETLCVEAAAHVSHLSDFADAVATLDVLWSFADNAARFAFVRPVVVTEPVLHIAQGRHPVLDRILRDRFVPNDCELGKGGGTEGQETAGEENTGASIPPPQSFSPLVPQPLNPSVPSAATLALITGPNMAGKSTYIRQVALITLLAHTGSFVPAESATIGLVDRIFTRIGASDELHAGYSTFMVEMTETANILHHATERSLVVLDEIGRGTSTLDGLSLAWAIAESLARVGCRTLFATHYHELTALAERLPAVRNLHVAVREWGAPGSEEIIFLYRILPGRADRSYGIHVARIAGVPSETIDRARALLETLAVHSEEEFPREAAGAAGAPSSASAGAQLSLFTEYLDHPAIELLRTLELDGLSPLQAFDALRQLKELLQPPPPRR
jgi:DNA mismatch repair protein MutS